MSKLRDLTGQTFNRLTVLDRDMKKTKRVYWICKCSCGKTVSVVSDHLTNNHTKSCGCLLGDKNKERLTKRNTYVKKDNYLEVYANGGQIFLIDSEFEYLLKNNCWRISGGYVVNPQSKQIHRLITNAGEGQYVDHINHDTLNNKKLNLRVCTPSENAMNRSPDRRNKSGKVGVCYFKSINKWHAYISVNKKELNLGYYCRKEDAVKIRREAEIKYYGEFRFMEEINN